MTRPERQLLLTSPISSKPVPHSPWSVKNSLTHVCEETLDVEEYDMVPD